MKEKQSRGELNEEETRKLEAFTALDFKDGE